MINPILGQLTPLNKNILQEVGVTAGAAAQAAEARKHAANDQKCSDLGGLVYHLLSNPTVVLGSASCLAAYFYICVAFDTTVVLSPQVPIKEVCFVSLIWTMIIPLHSLLIVLLVN